VKSRPGQERSRYVVRKQRGILLLHRADYAEAEPRATVFLDRDGVLNKRISGGYVTKWSEFVLLSGAFRALRQLRSLGFQLVIVSNQAAVGKGLMTCEGLAEITQRSLAQFDSQGSAIDAAFFCLHQPADDCKCRKPRPGLLRESARHLKIDFRRAFLIGDSPSDITAGSLMGCKTVYLSALPDVSVKANYQCGSLAKAVRWIEEESVRGQFFAR
jgi:histidinol-phosphate phosphatase family protein